MNSMSITGLLERVREAVSVLRRVSDHWWELEWM